MTANVSNFPYSSGRRIALASEGPAVLRTSREGGGGETERGDWGGCGGRWGHLQDPACVPFSFLTHICVVPVVMTVE